MPNFKPICNFINSLVNSQKKPIVIPATPKSKSFPGDIIFRRLRESNLSPTDLVAQNVKPDNFLGSGTSATAHGINTPGFSQYVIRHPFGEKINGNQAIQLLGDSPALGLVRHPLSHKSNAGVPIARIGQFELQRRVPGKTAGSFYQEHDQHLDPLFSAVRTANTEEEMAEIIQTMTSASDNKTLRTHYEQWQKNYTGLFEEMAGFDQDAYDDVAGILTLGKKNGTVPDVNHANNILVDSQRRKFGLIDFQQDIKNPFMTPPTMEGFFHGIALNRDVMSAGARDLNLRRFMVLDPQLKPAFQGAWDTVIDKVEAAGKKVI
jgi:hypothetical protein